MHALIKKHAQKLRFGVVGIANTALDFAILFLLVHLGLDKIVGNYISTSVALIFSFFVNRSFTFKAKDGNLKKQIALFFVITIIGIWVIQPLVIAGVSAFLASAGLSKDLLLLIAKLIATVASLIWNYIMYARFAFAVTKPTQDDSKEA